MHTLESAKKIVLKKLPKRTVITAAIEYGDEFMFIAIRDDPNEGFFDPFFKVNKKTGAFTDFSPQDYDSPRDIIDPLVAQATQRSDHG